ncbi:AAA family ATPase [Plantactinospora sp. WMMB782]|uniref:AAA family ATPase n=1 Tax=Plantactinospora sp. WMMB782 TaxID=3404121 RepID=UPI003B952695
MTGQPLVVVTGPPAVGKTSVREVLRPILQQRSAVLELGIDDVLRDMYRRGLLVGCAVLGDDAALILSSWEVAVERALADLTRQLDLSHASPTLVEVPLVPQWLAALSRNSSLARRTLLIYLHAPVEVRVARNRRRGRDRVSEKNLREMSDHISPKLLGELAASTSAVFTLETTTSLDDVRRRCADRLTAFVEGWPE